MKTAVIIAIEEAERLAAERVAGQITGNPRLLCAKQNMIAWSLFLQRCLRDPALGHRESARHATRIAIKTYLLLREQERAGIFGRLDGDAP